MFDFNLLNGKELFEMGKRIGELAKERPDLAHRILFGIREGMEESIGFRYGFGDTCSALWRQWAYECAKDPHAAPPVPFADLKKRFEDQNL